MTAVGRYTSRLGVRALRRSEDLNQYVIRFLVVGSLLSGILIWGCQQTAPSRTIDSDGGIRLIYRVAQTADSVEAGRTLDEVIESAIQVLSRRSVTGLRPG